jgi:ferredoxin
LQDKDLHKDRPTKGVFLQSEKMALNQWGYDNAYHGQERQKLRYCDIKKATTSLSVEAEIGYDHALALKEAERCLDCDVQTVFTAKTCIECDACIDICPVDCLTLAHEQEDEGTFRASLKSPALNTNQLLFVSAPLPTGRVMVKDENLCLHCGLCAERCPTAAWDMQRATLTIPRAKDVRSVS